MESVDSARTPAGGRRLDAPLVGVMLAGFCTFLDLYMTQPLLPAFRHIFHAGEGAVSLTVSAATLTVALSAPFAGMLSDRIGRKKVIVTSVFLLVIPTILAATSPSLNALVFWRLVQGVFLPGIFCVSMAYVNEEYQAGGAGKAMAFYITGNVLGGFMGRFISGLLADHFGWRSPFLVLALVNLAGAIAIWRLLPGSRNFVAVDDWRDAVRSVRDHMTNGKLVATYAVGFSVLFAQVATFTYISFYLAEPPFNLGTSALGILFFVYLLGVAITPMSGRAIDRFGHRNVLIAGVATSCIGVLMALSHVLGLEIVALAIAASGVFVSQVAGSSHVGVSTDHGRSAASGLYVMWYYLGGTAGAAVPAALWAIGGWPACAALIVGVQVAAVAIALVFWAPRVAVVKRGVPAQTDALLELD
ncbi:MAG: MFS transporter [Capsulimonadaceae bacterium]|nr:MFS transporter [Capsulimonadaceae bacterium]